MKLQELFSKLKILQVKVVYIIHRENPDFEELIKIQRFEDKVKRAGFIPLTALNFRPYGKALVSKAISISNFALVLALDPETEKTAREKGVDFVYIEEALE